MAGLRLREFRHTLDAGLFDLKSTDLNRQHASAMLHSSFTGDSRHLKIARIFAIADFDPFNRVESGVTLTFPI
jgi:hypothetical protein